MQSNNRSIDMNGSNRISRITITALALCALMTSAFAAQGMQGIDGIPYPARKAAVVSDLRIPVQAPARAINLGAVSAPERASDKETPAASGKNRPLQVGFARVVPASDGQFKLSQLDWQSLASGERV